MAYIHACTTLFRSDGENDLNQFTVGERPGDRRAQNSTISNICGEENN